eukprot:6379909-Pyramimonas_sp.AAC.1
MKITGGRVVARKECIDSPRGGMRRVAPTPNPPGLHICTATGASPKNTFTARLWLPRGGRPKQHDEPRLS